MSKIKISIVICTYNRADLLQGAIHSVLKHEHSINEYELLVVDNNSSDATRSVVEEFASQYPHVRYILETNLGLSHARNRGWKEANGEYIGYLDDDCEVPPGWFSNAVRVATEIRPESFGGPHYAFYKTPRPIWFKDQYGSESLSEIARPLKKNEFLIGMNMFIRRDVFESLGGFQSALGMTGKKIAYGEETHFFNQLRAHHPEAILYYDPGIFVYHLVRAEKMDLLKIPGRFLAVGRYSYRVFNQPDHLRIFRSLAGILRTITRLMKACTWDGLTRNRVKYPFMENYLFECGFQGFIDLGEQVEALAQTLNLKR